MASLMMFMFVYVLFGLATLSCADQCEDELRECYEQRGAKAYPDHTNPWELRDFLNGQKAGEPVCLHIGKLVPQGGYQCVQEVSSCENEEEKAAKQRSAMLAVLRESQGFTATMIHRYVCNNKGCPKDGTTWQDMLDAAIFCAIQGGTQGEVPEQCTDDLPEKFWEPQEDENKCATEPVTICGQPNAEEGWATVTISYYHVDQERCTYKIRLPRGEKDRL